MENQPSSQSSLNGFLPNAISHLKVYVQEQALELQTYQDQIISRKTTLLQAIESICDSYQASLRQSIAPPSHRTRREVFEQNNGAESEESGSLESDDSSSFEESSAASASHKAVIKPVVPEKSQQKISLKKMTLKKHSSAHLTTLSQQSKHQATDKSDRNLLKEVLLRATLKRNEQ